MKTKIFLFALLLISIKSYDFVKYDEEDEIGIITISRPKALNALNSQVLDELSETLDFIDISHINALIITG